MRCLVKASLVALFTLMPSVQPFLPVSAQDLPMRQRSTWSGDSGPPAQGYYPGVEQDEIRRNQAVLEQWQQAERNSAATRWTPQNVLRNMETQIQQADAAGNYAAAAHGYERLAETLASPGVERYAGGLTVWDCYKGEAGERLKHITQAERMGDITDVKSEWSALLPIADRLAQRDPMNPQWCYLQGMAAFHGGAYMGAEERLNRCMNMSDCPPDLRANCSSAIAKIKSEEQRAELERQRERAAAEAARRKQAEATAGNKKSNTIVFNQETWSAIDLVKYCGLGDQMVKQKNYDEAIADYKKAIASNPNAEPAYIKLGFAYGLKLDPAHSEEAFRNAARLEPNDARAWFDLAGALEMQGKKSEAIANYKKARELHDPEVEKLVNEKLARIDH